ncbi:hypothetical protein JCM19046_1119 [Bacillus sp. JCM 19046]|nr:hypothetical protein JCM19045_4969 [Bacillus sp. JCM 19045]GAF16659.1 hypothetical protein JCM19046_1119 [Bacillus sp. JCM 19046]
MSKIQKTIFYLILISIIPFILAFWDVINGEEINWSEHIIFSVVVVPLIYVVERVLSMKNK